MGRNGRGVLGRWDATNEEIRDAMALGINQALREHKRIGNPIVTWDREHDRIVIVPPEDIEVPDDDALPQESGPTEG